MNRKGFTLIELAIVLVIIGIILGAVIKGQDLINNARMKKLTAQVRTWEVALWTCYDRLGHFPGDTDNNGTINSNPVNDTCVQNLAQRPVNSLQLGSYTFHIYAGIDANSNNVIAICGASGCGSVTGDNTYADYLANLDTSIDGEADAGTGVVREINSISVTGNVVTTATVNSTANSSWTSTAIGAIYYFDKQP